jgi:pSer/pThr/pTyr-binding forkhead associated (FHA) protein
MLLRFKTIFTGCCQHDQTLSDQMELDIRRRSVPLVNKKIGPNLKTENDISAERIELTTAEDETVIKHPRLKLTVIGGDILPSGQEFIINNNGLENSHNKKMDGIVHIGKSKHAKKTPDESNDIVLDDYTVGDRHCTIKYNFDLQRYFIKDQGNGSGTFVKVKLPTKVKNGTVISFGESHSVVQIMQPKNMKSSARKSLRALSLQDLDKDFLVFKFLDGPKASQVFNFGPEEFEVKIGRANDCHVRFEGNNFSRYQCNFKYIDGQWHVCDGTGKKPSSNGTWILVDKFQEIKSGMKIKIGQSFFRANII